jgi:hypothetical protein
MPGDEIEVPKELREFMFEEAEETNLGQKKWSTKTIIVMVICILENMMINF